MTADAILRLRGTPLPVISPAFPMILRMSECSAVW